jgi:hypothetical protein
MNQPTSLYDRLFGQTRKLYLIALACLAMLSLPFLWAWLDGSLESFLADGSWLGLMAGPVVITYILMISPAISRVQGGVLISLRPIVQLDDRAFNALVQTQGSVTPRQELLTFGVGAAVGAVQVLTSREGERLHGLEIYWLLTIAILYGLLAWVIYAAVRGTNLVRAIHQQPMHVDPLDTSPFTAVGRQGLMVSLVFIGGITVSLLFLVHQPEILRNPVFWLVYVPLAAVPVALFFLSMRPTHTVLGQAKRAELARVSALLNAGYRRLADLAAQQQPTGNLPAEVGALLAFEGRLRQARTWPYDTGMLRTLAFSILVPAATVVVRNLLDRLFA